MFAMVCTSETSCIFFDLAVACREDTHLLTRQPSDPAVQLGGSKVRGCC